MKYQDQQYIENSTRTRTPPPCVASADYHKPVVRSLTSPEQQLIICISSGLGFFPIIINISPTTNNVNTVERIRNTQLRIPQDWKITAHLPACGWLMEPAASSVHTEEVVFPSVHSSLPNYRQRNLQDGRSMASTIIKQVLWVYRDFRCKHLTVQERMIRKKRLSNKILSLAVSHSRWEEAEEGFTSNQSNLKMKTFDKPNLKRAEGNFPKTSQIQQTTSRNFPAPTATDGSAVRQCLLIFLTLYFFLGWCSRMQRREHFLLGSLTLRRPNQLIGKIICGLIDGENNNYRQFHQYNLVFGPEDFKINSQKQNK